MNGALSLGPIREDPSPAGEFWGVGSSPTMPRFATWMMAWVIARRHRSARKTVEKVEQIFNVISVGSCD